MNRPISRKKDYPSGNISDGKVRNELPLYLWNGIFESIEKFSKTKCLAHRWYPILL